MGLFSFSSYGPGRGVRKDERKLKRPFLFFYYLFFNFFKIVKLSMLFLVTCIPVVTIGPSICGLTYISQCFTENNPVFLISDYFEHFKKNFFKSIFAFFLSLIPVFSFILVFINLKTVPHFSYFTMPLLLVNLIVLMMSFYIYPLLVFYDIPFFAVLKNSFIFALIKLPLNLFIAFVVILIVALSFGFIPQIGWVLAPFFLTSFINYFTTYSVWPTIKKNMEE